MTALSQRDGLESMPFKFEAIGSSDVGCVREENEDAFWIGYARNSRLRYDGGLLAIVADGVGGHAAGKIASQKSVEVIASEVVASPPEREIPQILQDAIETAHLRLNEQMQNDRSLRGMGTTCTAAWLSGREAYVAQIGDSRAYLVRDGHIIQITEDQTVVQSLVNEGVISETEAATHPERHLLSQALGVSEQLNIDIRHVPLQMHDRMVLCSDGLHGLVADAEIATAVTTAETAEKSAQQLIEMAKARGGNDNITVVIASIVPQAPSSSTAKTVISQAVVPDNTVRPERPPKKTNRIYLWLLVLAAAGLLYYLLVLAPNLSNSDSPGVPQSPIVTVPQE